MPKNFLHDTPRKAIRAATVAAGEQRALFQGDCLELLAHVDDESVDLVISSPPYCIGKEYEPKSALHDFSSLHRQLLPELVRVLKPGGSLCWQVGSHVKNGVVTPLDYLVFAEMQRFDSMHMRNRVVWTFGHGLHCSNRFSGRHEVIMWYTKGHDYQFNLDAVRIPQKYPGKTSSRGENKGKPSGHPNGKNPGDVWNIPNVKANHVEKTAHPCQFPVAIPQIMVRALTAPSSLVFDPFTGSGTTAVACELEKRRFLGAEIDPKYCAIAKERMTEAADDAPRVRPWNKEIFVPNPQAKVARLPENFAQAQLATMKELFGLSTAP
ncbi:DNA-methyltransferase [Paraburkholderia bannensis]|uniref:DNA-methyltransferase n=1 Tax=Paraburkholderia bannensis TaxID=765414 RepID=UPI002AB5F8DA|nr:site-specific DNA-methyltransferase [Paraburkholderia bannensis]